jgi:hypothetical protein
MNNFEDDYYDAFMEVEVIGFIRCESDLKYFGNNKFFLKLNFFFFSLDYLIKMIHNDVQTVKEYFTKKQKI